MQSWREHPRPTRLVGYVLLVSIVVSGGLLCAAVAILLMQLGSAQQTMTFVEQQALMVRFLNLWAACVVSMVPPFAIYAFAPQRVIEVIQFLMSTLGLGNSWLFSAMSSGINRGSIRAIGVMGLLMFPVIMLAWAWAMRLILAPPP